MMEQNDEDFNYDSQYKKLCTGLGSFLNSAQQNNYFEEGSMTNDGSASFSSASYSSNELSKCKKQFLVTFSSSFIIRQQMIELYYSIFYISQFIVCDTGITFPNKPKASQPKNRMYECKLCNVECNSEFMYQQHVQGSKHKKKVEIRIFEMK